MTFNNEKFFTQLHVNGTSVLQEKRIHSLFFNGKKISEDVKELDYPLYEVTENKLFQLRVSNQPGFVYKCNGKYYYAEIPETLRFYSSNIVVAHCCAQANFECEHLSAASDSEGGCPKVRDFSLSPYQNITTKNKSKKVQASKRIEKYDFITEGFESFNTLNNCLVVIKCDNYKKRAQQNKEED